MSKPAVSLVIPARNEPYLERTLADALQKASGRLEAIAVLDGYWPTRTVPGVRYVHRPTPLGMRAAINAGVELATGDHVLKADGHCMFSEGFDAELAATCQADWVIVPRRKRLDPAAWELIEDGRPDIDYMYLSYPEPGKSLHGRPWDARNKDPELRDVEVDDLMSAQGSAWFMRRDYYDWLELMDERSYGPFANEFQEIGLKCWLSGGRVAVDKRCWYAHWHKSGSRGYPLPSADVAKGAEQTLRWLTAEGGWSKATLPLSSLIERFWPVPGWPDPHAANGNGHAPAEVEPPTDVLGYLAASGVDVEAASPIRLAGTRNETFTALLRATGCKVGVEVGTEEGVFAEHLCRSVPGLHLTCVDAWETYAGYQEHRRRQEKLDGWHAQTVERLAPFDVTILRQYSADAAKSVPDGSLDFVYIDANHELRYVLEDIYTWVPKVRPGGIVAGHDFRGHIGSLRIDVETAVRAYTQAKLIAPWFVIDDPETTPTWFWVNA